MQFLNFQMKYLWRHRKYEYLTIALKIKDSISGLSEEFSWIHKVMRLDWKKQLLGNLNFETHVHSFLYPRPETQKVS